MSKKLTEVDFMNLLAEAMLCNGILTTAAEYDRAMKEAASKFINGQNTKT